MASTDFDQTQVVEKLAALRQRWLSRVEFGLAGGFVLREHAVPLPSAGASEGDWYIVTASSGMCVREDPSQMATVIGSLPYGATFQAGRSAL